MGKKKNNSEKINQVSNLEDFVKPSDFTPDKSGEEIGDKNNKRGVPSGQTTKGLTKSTPSMDLPVEEGEQESDTSEDEYTEGVDPVSSLPSDLDELEVTKNFDGKKPPRNPEAHIVKKKEREQKVLFYIMKDAIDKRSNFGFRFFEKKGYRLYNPKKGYWALLNDEKVFQVEEYILKTVIMNRTLRGVKQFHEPSFWSKFMIWYEKFGKAVFPKYSKWLVSFKDVTVDTRTLIMKPHTKFLFCYRYVPSKFNGGNLSQEAMDFFIDLSCGDPVKLNVVSFLEQFVTKL